MDWRSGDTGLEEAMWQMNFQDGKGPYPERPGEIDCSYYMQTGVCAFGMNCRFNHPQNRNQVAATSKNRGYYPERPGEPECQYFMKTGTCKFGATCKYHHPRFKARTEQLRFNLHGYPFRPNEKECSYYIKTGQCKYGITCKFHHPSPASASLTVPNSPFPSTIPSLLPLGPQTYVGALPTMPIPRPTMISSSYLPGSPTYLPVMYSPGAIPVPAWSSFPSSGQVGPVATDGRQQISGTGLFFGPRYPKDGTNTSMPGFYTSYFPPSSSIGVVSINAQTEHIHPERPGQPECQYYMKTGNCKFGSTCKYHHPRERNPSSASPLNLGGLPQRQGVATCPFYSRQGFCKYGLTCKYDHPIGTLSYSPSASSLADMPVAPYSVGSTSATLAPSSSSSELRIETYAEISKDSIGTSETPPLPSTSKSLDSLAQSTADSHQCLNSSDHVNISIGKKPTEVNGSANVVSRDGDAPAES